MADRDTSPRLLMMIARNESTLDELLTGLLDAGVSGATVIDSKGLSAILRDDMPIFAGLGALLPQAGGSAVLLSVTTTDRIDRLRKFVDEMPEAQRPISVVLPVDSVFGLFSDR